MLLGDKWLFSVVLLESAFGTHSHMAGLPICPQQSPHGADAKMTLEHNTSLSLSLLKRRGKETPSPFHLLSLIKAVWEVCRCFTDMPEEDR